MNASVTFRSLSLAALACASLSVIACSSSSSSSTPGNDAATNDGATHQETGAETLPTQETGAETSTDAGTETATDDAGTDVGTDAPLACIDSLDAGYTCPAAQPATGGTSCSDDALTSFLAACIDGSGSDCDTWISANGGADGGVDTCNGCLNNWFYTQSGYPNEGACYLLIDSTATACAADDACYTDCVESNVCYDCQDTDTDYAQCAATVTAAGGVCAQSNATELNGSTCAGNAKFAPCLTPNLNTDDGLIQFLRGACRDNGNWTNAANALDAGVSDAPAGG